MVVAGVVPSGLVPTCPFVNNRRVPAGTSGLEAQLNTLADLGCAKVFSEQVSSRSEREELERCLEYIREGDVLCATKLNRLGRSIEDLVDISKRIEDKGAHLRILDMNIDTSTPTGKLMFTVLGGIGKFERDIMLELQKEGIAKARAERKYKGRVPTARRQSDEVIKLHNQGLKPSEIGKELGISRTSVWRIVKVHREANGWATNATA